MVTSTDKSRGLSDPTASNHTVDAAPSHDHTDSGCTSQEHTFREASDRVISDRDLDELFVGVKTFLEDATKAHSVASEPDPLLNGPVYTWRASDTDLRRLLHHILDETTLSSQFDSGNALSSSRGSKSLDQCPRILKSTHPTALGPAMTISVPEASFTSDTQAQNPHRDSTTATIFSPENVTEITWQASFGRLEAAGDPRHSSVGSDVSRLSSETSETSSGQTTTKPRGKQISPVSRSTTGPSSKPNLFSQDGPGTRKRISMIFMTSTDETAQHVAQQAEEPEQKFSYLGRFRKKSIQLGQSVGSFMNGDYRNDDHKPRRESTIVRLRSALDRIEPSRPKQDASIFGAFTGAQPTDAVDQYHARRPGPPNSTCSEDGRLHRCVQHEVTESPPG